MKNKFGFAIIKDSNGHDIFARTPNQLKFTELIDNNQVIFADGPAGCGKTFIAVAKAIQYMRSGKFKKIVLTRPAVESGESLGFLPGALDEKIAPYMTPLYEYLSLFTKAEKSKLQGKHPSKYKEKKMKKESKDSLQSEQTVTIGDFIQVVPLAFMRGMTFNDSIILVDEAQNISKKQMVMLLTRIGFNSKIIITGDQSQRDIDNRENPGFLDAMNRLHNVGHIAAMQFEKSDVLRNDIIQDILEAYSID